ncbi:Fic family protein [Shouchella sp. 1P09AA]|uniref:Fic family protein n=1 Tax=unclassified Shouchella TaxID=2893065 RepID=UPI00399FCB48
MSKFSQIDDLKAMIDQLRPFPQDTLRSLRADFLLNNTYHSNAIEGNTLSLYETKVVLEDGLTIGGKTVREHLEIINHKEASLYMEERIGTELNELFIKAIHAIILKGVDDKSAGSYRKEEVLISGATHQVTPSYLINEQMEELVAWHAANEDMHPVEKASRLHSMFVNIHPFRDGNGRTARLLMNFELLSAGFLPVLFRVEDRSSYYSALDLAGAKSDFNPFIDMAIKLEQEQLAQYFSYLNQ